MKRAIAFVDGQNLFYAAKASFGYLFPNYDVSALAARVCQQQGLQLAQTRFYSGFPSADDNPFWNHFWRAKFQQVSVLDNCIF
jgi:hypothetical protein